MKGFGEVLMIRKLYPNGKRKAFNVTYDDGVLQDVRFVELLNKYKLKGTFNLNSVLMKKEFQWTHNSGLVVKRLKVDDVVSLYKGHEVASHTKNHPYMEELSREEIMNELSEDKANLEKIFGYEIKGFAVPFHYYSELIAECVKDCGFEYGRISEESCLLMSTFSMKSKVNRPNEHPSPGMTGTPVRAKAYSASHAPSLSNPTTKVFSFCRAYSRRTSEPSAIGPSSERE